MERLATEDIAVILVAYHAGGKGLTIVQGMSLPCIGHMLGKAALSALDRTTERSSWPDLRTYALVQERAHITLLEMA